jgi:protein-tyrosine phosphatase
MVNLSIQNSRFTFQNCTTDFHSHILPGLDDGSSSVDESLQIARLLAAGGFTQVHCTPHCIKGMYETTPEQVLQGVERLQGEIERAGIALQLLGGMEYCLDEFFPAELERLLPLGDSRLVLVEIPWQGDATLLKEHIFQLRRRQYTPLIAHPERSPLLHPQPQEKALKRFLNRFSMQHSEISMQNSLLEELRTMGCLFQGNLGSFSGFYGAGVKRVAEGMRESGIYHCYGSDAHKPSQVRALGMPD